MKLSQFIYECVKKASDYGETAMTYESFLLGGMDKQEDYSKFLDKAYPTTNAFFRRLSSLKKLLLKTITFPSISERVANASAEEYENEEKKKAAIAEAMSPLFILPDGIFNVEAVYQVEPYSYSYKNYRFAITHYAGKKCIIVNDSFNKHREMYMDCIAKLPIVGKGNIVWIEQARDGSENDIYFVGSDMFDTFNAAFDAAELGQLELEDYGITDEMAYIGIDWVAARLNEDTSLGHSQEIEAESRLMDIPEAYCHNQIIGGKTIV